MRIKIARAGRKPPAVACLPYVFGTKRHLRQSRAATNINNHDHHQRL
jgi:hypothetical protein